MIDVNIFAVSDIEQSAFTLPAMEGINNPNVVVEEVASSDLIELNSVQSNDDQNGSGAPALPSSNSRDPVRDAAIDVIAGTPDTRQIQKEFADFKEVLKTQMSDFMNLLNELPLRV